jgi:hypothetical protein
MAAVGLGDGLPFDESSSSEQAASAIASVRQAKSTTALRDAVRKLKTFYEAVVI